MFSRRASVKSAYFFHSGVMAAGSPRMSPRPSANASITLSRSTGTKIRATWECRSYTFCSTRPRERCPFAALLGVLFEPEAPFGIRERAQLGGPQTAGPGAHVLELGHARETKSRFSPCWGRTGVRGAPRRASRILPGRNAVSGEVHVLGLQPLGSLRHQEGHPGTFVQ